jgi:hypothetical protein
MSSPSSGVAGTAFITRVEVSDDFGVDRVLARLVNLSNQVVSPIVTGSRISGTSKSGTYTVDLQALNTARSGDIFVVEVSGQDLAGNYSAWVQVSRFTIAAPSNDSQRPIIVAGSGVVEKASVVFGQSFTFTFRVTDNAEVFSTGGIVYRPDQWPVKEVDGGVLISGNYQDGTWRVTIDIPRTVNKGGIENNPIGTYSVYAKARDLANNVTRLEDGNYYVYIGTVSVTG